MFVCLVGFLTSSSTTRLYLGRAPRQERLTILRAATHETELGDHDFCLSRSHYTDTDPTCRERAATAGIEPGTSSPGVARSTAEPSGSAPRPPEEDGPKRPPATIVVLPWWPYTVYILSRKTMTILGAGNLNWDCHYFGGVCVFHEGKT